VSAFGNRLALQFFNLAAKFDVRNTKDMSISYDLWTPEPFKRNHKLTSYYKGNKFPPRLEAGGHLDFLLGYENDASMAQFQSKGSIKSKIDMANTLVLEWGDKIDTAKLDSNFLLREAEDKTECIWDLFTPYYADEKTLNLEANYFTQDIYKILHATINSPESRKITSGDVAFADLTNMKGSINSSLPIFNLTWFDVNFDFDTKNEESGKFIKASWPDNYALLDSKSNFVNENNHKEWKGTIKTELPLHTKHNIQIIYGLEVCNPLNFLTSFTSFFL
jgi:hypothetical protein